METEKPEYLVLTKEEARDIVNGDSECVTILQELVGNSRWSLDYRLVFGKDGKFYETSYSRGATECQDEQPFEYEDEVKCIRVYPYTKEVIDYK